MSVAAIPDPITPPRGSHRVDARDDKVVIRNLELFIGFDPSIDDGEDDEIAAIGDKQVSQIVERTREFMKRGTNPKLVLLHEDKEAGTPPEAIGDVIAVRKKRISGAPGIVGDVEMSRSDFDLYIRSNRYPRRSAEIWPDWFMSEIALLGRHTPRRPLPDTKFTRTGRKQFFTRNFGVGPGDANTFIPSTGTKRKRKSQMPNDEDDDKGDDRDKLIEQLRAELEEKDDEIEAMRNQLGESDEDDDEEDTPPKKDDKMESSRIAKLEKENRKLKVQFKRAECNRELDSLAADGFAVEEHRDDMLEELMECKDVDRKITFWRGTLRKSILNKRLPVHTFRTSGGEEEVAYGDEADTQDDRLAALPERVQKLVCNRARDAAVKEGDYTTYGEHLESELVKAEKRKAS